MNNPVRAFFQERVEIPVLRRLASKDHFPYEDMYTFSEFERQLEATGFSIVNKKYSNLMKLLKYVSLSAKSNK